MQITFDTQNPQDLAILSKLMDMAGNELPVPTGKAQPAVANNTGTTATGSTFHPEGSGVAGAAQEAAPVPVKKGKRVVKEAASTPLEDVSKEADEIDTSAERVEASDKPLNLDDVRAALQQYTASKGVPAGIELLKTFNAGRISELDAGMYANFVLACAA